MYFENIKKGKSRVIKGLLNCLLKFYNVGMIYDFVFFDIFVYSVKISMENYNYDILIYILMFGF